FATQVWGKVRIGHQFLTGRIWSAYRMQYAQRGNDKRMVRSHELSKILRRRGIVEDVGQAVGAGFNCLARSFHGTDVDYSQPMSFVSGSDHSFERLPA